MQIQKVLFHKGKCFYVRDLDRDFHTQFGFIKKGWGIGYSEEEGMTYVYDTALKIGFFLEMIGRKTWRGGLTIGSEDWLNF